MLNIKKYILLSLLVTSNASAFVICDPYLKLGVGLSQISPVAINTAAPPPPPPPPPLLSVGRGPQLADSIQTNNLNGKIKLARRFPLVEVGLGYQLTDSIRTEIVFDHYFLFYSKENSSNTSGDVFKVIYETKSSALMLNAHKDIITYGIFTPFVGGGIGVSFLRDTATGTGKNSANDVFEILDPVSSQQLHRFAYKFTAGIDIKLTDNSTLDLSYNYLNLGRNGSGILDNIYNMPAREYLLHNLTASIRIKF
jgi:opacity protein-like surface antigen